MSAVPVWEAESLQAPGLRHGFFGRRAGRFGASRKMAARALGVTADNLAGVHQVHSARVVSLDAPWPGDAPKADALVTRSPGLALSISTADCAPVLLADTAAGVIGAAHAGWRGALGGVLEATLAAMQKLGASADNTRAAIGPCIGQQSYQVGPEFRQSFVASGPDPERFFIPGAGDRWHFDLPGYCAARLTRAGAGAVEILPMDTCALENAFFSYRRACLRGEPDQGRNLSAIVLQET